MVRFLLPGWRWRQIVSCGACGGVDFGCLWMASCTWLSSVRASSFIVIPRSFEVRGLGADGFTCVLRSGHVCCVVGGECAQVGWDVSDFVFRFFLDG